MNSEEIENFIQDVRSDLGNLDELINPSKFLRSLLTSRMKFSISSESIIFVIDTCL